MFFRNGCVEELGEERGGEGRRGERTGGEGRRGEKKGRGEERRREERQS